MYLSRLLLLLIALGLAACQTTRSTKEVWPYPEPPVATRPVPPDSVPPTVTVPPGTPGGEVEVQPPEPRPVPNYPRTAEQISGGAVTSLMKQARQHLAAGKPDQAAGVLERAVRIEPRNYFVWSALGQSYLAQKNYAQAESVAQKSNVLARGNAWVELENWKTIAASRLARDDGSGAQAAQTRIEELTAWLSAAPTP